MTARDWSGPKHEGRPTGTGNHMHIDSPAPAIGMEHAITEQINYTIASSLDPKKWTHTRFAVALQLVEAGELA